MQSFIKYVEAQNKRSSAFDKTFEKEKVKSLQEASKRNNGLDTALRALTKYRPEESITVSQKDVRDPKWLSKDRFWSFVFWFGMSGGFTLMFVLGALELHNVSCAVIWTTTIGVPLIVRAGSKTSFLKDEIFLSSEGREIDINKDLPSVGLVIVATIALTALTCSLGSVPNINKILAMSLVTSIFFGVPTLFFIFKNCPISILFNRKFWALRAANYEHSNISKRSSGFSSSRTRSSRPSGSDYITNPVYSGLDSNIYHRHRRH